MNLTIEPTAREMKFINAYIKAIYFTERVCLPDNIDRDRDLDSEFLRESVIDCLAFLNHNICYLSDNQFDQAGHDFWLTRNGHGTGFWDRTEVYGHYSERFTKVSENFGEVQALFDL